MGQGRLFLVPVCLRVGWTESWEVMAEILSGQRD